MKQIKFSITRTDSKNADFEALVKLLDKELAIRDGSDHEFYAQFNKIDLIQHVVVAYDGTIAVGCGAIKQFDNNSMEVKRMYTKDEYRGRGVATQLLRALEQWSMALGMKACVLETGIRQPEAIALYEKNNYVRISNYGQYIDIAESICFKKELSETI